MKLCATCWQCGVKRTERYAGWTPGNAREAFRAELNRSGWFLWQRYWRFCPACAMSAKLAMGIAVAAKGG